MPIQVLIGAVAIAAAIPLLYLTISAPGGRGIFTKRTSVLGDVTDVREIMLERGVWERMGRPSVEGIGGVLTALSPQGWLDRKSRDLVLAGLSGRVSVEQLALVKAAFGGAFLLFGLIIVAPRVDLGWLVALLMGAIGFFGPDAVLSKRARDRQRRIEVELPDVIDQVTMSMNAGLGFEAALARAARVGSGPLSAELSRVAQEMSLGVSRADALRALAARTDVADLKSFVIAVVQSEEYGLAITKVLDVQAEELRDKRRQRAEERALKIPVLLIFPLAVCIFPTIFIILMGPALIRIYEGMALIRP